MCEERLDTNTTVPAFHGKSFIQLHLGRPGLAGLRADLRLEFRTFLSSCLLYHSPGGQRRSGDFLSLSVRDKHLEFSFSLSGAKLRLVSEEPVMLGRWHSVRVQRYRTHAMLQLDDLQPVRGQTQSSLSTLDLAHISYLGHSPSLSLPGLQGCVRSLRVGRSQDIPQLDVVPDLKMVQACRVLNNFYEIIKVLKSFEILHTLVCLIDVLS